MEENEMDVRNETPNDITGQTLPQSTRYLNADWSTRMGGCPEIDKEELESQSRRRCGPVLH
ncbi:hypothetical protein OUZ56_002418 [Daphnia magna]|uniref:Uncharacterized protein n=1 Tax=Daphnia magna TaxID=35525 RepID=A0ABR0A616_9CRUS|nr:hypothetical protein OUZ56_002418 [Daphnia magna]